MINGYQKLSDLDLVECAYRALKQNTYWDNVDLFLRKSVAAFETGDDFQDRLNTIAEFISSIRKNNVSSNNFIFTKWLKQISFRCLPKSIKNDNGQNAEERFITNDRSHKEYEFEGVNYFIDAPVELHLIDFIWCMTAGYALDATLDKYCLGHRLEKQPDKIYPHYASRLFKYFPKQYSDWRDTAIKKASENLDKKKNILIIGLDLKQCFYHLEADWIRLKKLLDRISPDDTFLPSITDALKQISDQYHKVSKSYLKHSHSTAIGVNGLPVGISSSRIIANWMLNRFDRQAKKTLKPIYYGRYVDDILMVIPALKKSLIKKGSGPVLNKLFIKSGLFEKAQIDGNSEYRISILKTLSIQPKKLVLQYFNHRQSHAGLKEFKRAIDEQASEFRFLPIEDDSRGLDECAFDLIYKGSVNKLRSVIGLEENSTELSKYLSRRIIQYRLSADGFKKENVDQLFRFYKGKNIFDFCRLWEKVFTLFLTNGKEADCAKFYNTCEKTINKLKHIENKLEEKVCNDTLLYLQLALAMPLALRERDIASNLKSKVLKKIILSDSMMATAVKFRDANLIRHHFVSYPLINYTGYDGNLLEFNPELLEKIDSWSIVDGQKWSPRYIHYDEIQLFLLLKEIIQNSEKLNKESVYLETQKIHNENSYHEILPTFHKIDNAAPSVDATHICICNNRDKEQELQVGIANLKVDERDILCACHPKKQPNLSFERQSVLYQLINESVKNPKCDLIVLPELSVPVAWLPFMISQARKHQLAMVFGLEHWVSKDTALNFVATVLPYQVEDVYKSAFVSLRLKNYYAPSEKKMIDKLKLSIPGMEKPYYEKFCWKGGVFSVYNCFELSNIHNRGIFRSELDYLISVVWNKDIKYYANIIQSSVRDLHCYIIQANTSDYGDSRISAPKKSEQMDFVRVKGGSNPTLLKAKLDLKALRKFQCNAFDADKDLFKPVPAGYDRSKAKKRAKQGGCDYFIKNILSKG